MKIQEELMWDKYSGKFTRIVDLKCGFEMLDNLFSILNCVKNL